METIVLWIYKHDAWKGRVINFLLAKNASKEDAEDVFQEGLSQMIVQIRDNNYRKTSALQTYLFAICKNIWHKRFSRKSHYVDILTQLEKNENTSVDLTTPEVFLLHTEQQERLQKLLAQLGEKCKKIISLWMLGYSIKEIVVKTEYKNENVVSKKKHYCTKELTVLLKKNPTLVDELLRKIT